MLEGKTNSEHMKIQFARGKDFIDLFVYKFQSEYNITNKSKSKRVVVAKGNKLG